MASRFDVLIHRLESQARAPIAASGNQNGAARDRADAKPVRGTKPVAGKQRGEHRHRHDA